MLLAVTAGLFYIQMFEEEHVEKVDRDIKIACKDIANLGRNKTPRQPQDIQLTMKNETSEGDKLPLQQGQVQECVLLLKDYKLTQELLLFCQLILLTLIPAAHYSVFTLPYALLGIFLYLVIAMSEANTDQTLRSISNGISGYFLLYFVMIDLVWHYSAKIVNDQQSTVGYHNIMQSQASLVAFYLKVLLFILEGFKFSQSYDFGPVYDDLRETYVKADTQKLPGCKKLEDEDKMEGQLGIRLNLQQRSKKERQNLLIKHKYLRHFHRSHSFITRLLQPASLFLLSVTQTIFLLGHGSLLFIIVLALALFGFLVDVKKTGHSDGGWNFYRRLSQVLLCIELLYILVQFCLNIFPQGESYEQVREEDELTVILGLGTEKQTNHRLESDQTSIYESLFPFGGGIIEVMLIAVFIRYMGKSRGIAQQDTQTKQREPSRNGEDDLLTVRTPDDGASASGRSDLRSQYSRKSGSVKQFQARAPRFEMGAGIDEKKPRQHDLFRYIIKEMEDEEEEDREDQEEKEGKVGEQRVVDPDQSVSKSEHKSEVAAQKPAESDMSFSIAAATSRSGRSRKHVRDFTFRGQMRQFFYWVYSSCQKGIERIIDLLIVHVNKVVLLALFLVAVSRPTVVNFLLFIMFLVMLLIPYQHERTYLRFAIGLNSVIILLIFAIDVVNEQDYASYRVWTLYAIGVQYKSENEQAGKLLKLKYLPYLILQVVLVLSFYVISSTKYEKFLKYYTDLEAEEKRNKFTLANKTALIKQRSGLNWNLVNKKESQSNHSKQEPKEGGHNEDVSESSNSLNQFEGGSQKSKEASEQQVEAPEELEQNSNEDEDVTQANLRKQQEVVMMYDPISKWILANAGFLLVLFIFLEVLLLPLSVMNIILLCLMTFIVGKLLFNETKTESYRSLKLTLQILNTFAIIYIFTKYLFLFTEYTKNIELKNKIENRYEYGAKPHIGSQEETENAKSELHKPVGKASLGDRLLQKMFGFQKTEDEKNEGGGLLLLKLFNLAIVLSLTNLLLSALKQRQLASIINDKKNEGNEMASRVTQFRQVWLWWHYFKVYLGFMVYFLLPITIILISFTWYPLTEINIPSAVYMLGLMIILGITSRNGFVDVHRAIGMLSQVMLLIVYVIYFLFYDLLVELSEQDDAYGLQALSILTGVSKNGEWQVPGTSENDEGSAVLIGLVPLFLGLSLCLIQVELESWFKMTFNVSLHLEDTTWYSISKLEDKKQRDHDAKREQEQQDLRRQVQNLDDQQQNSQSNPDSDSSNLTDVQDQVIQNVVKDLKNTDVDTVQLFRGDSLNDQQAQQQILSLLETRIGDQLSHESDNKDLESLLQSRLSDDSEEQSHQTKLINFILEILSLEAPYRHCYFIRNVLWRRVVAVGQAQSLVVYFGIYACLNKMNSFSLVEWGCLMWLLHLNFRPDLFKHTDKNSYTRKYNIKASIDSDKNQRVVFASALQIAIISFLVVAQMISCIYGSLFFSQQEELQRNLSSSLCYNNQQNQMEEEYDEQGNIYQTASPLQAGNFNRECSKDWGYYLLGTNSIPTSPLEATQQLKENQLAVQQALFIDFMFLLSSYLLYLVSSHQIALIERMKIEVPVLEDQNDFASESEAKNQNIGFQDTALRLSRIVSYVYFPYLLIIYLLVASSTLNGHMVSDLTSSIYLWFALVFIVRLRNVFITNVKVLRPLKTYNRIVISLILLYQAPLFLCPTSIDIQGYSDPDYVTTEDCALIMHMQAKNPTDLSQRKEAKSQTMQLYIILMHSLGLLKENQVNMILLFIFLLTEIQQQLFQSPLFREYVVKHTNIEKESVGKLRAFMFTERFHLCRHWAYQAIKEEIKIMHKILVRLNERVTQSHFIKNLNDFLESKQTPKQEEEQSLLENEAAVETPQEKLAPLIDRVTLESLNHDKPVIPLKVVESELMKAFKEEFDEDEQPLNELTMEEIRGRVKKLINGKLDEYAYAKSRLDLYHKEGLGLSVALPEKDRVGHKILEAESAAEAPVQSDGLSEADSLDSQERVIKAFKEATEQLGVSRQALYSALYSHHLKRDEKEQPSEQQKSDERVSEDEESLEDEPFNPTSASLELDEEAFEKRLEDEAWYSALSLRFRYFLWRNYVDHLLLVNLSKSKDQLVLQRPILDNFGLFHLTAATIMTQSQVIVMIALAFNFLMNANLISFFAVLSHLAYQLMENPIAPARFWKFKMSYMLVVIAVKFVYQLPIFCGTPVYTFYSDKCNNEELIPVQLANRIDYIIGVHKFSGPSSYPKNSGIFFGIFADVMLLMTLLLHKQYLQKIGAWNYVKTERNIYKNPSFAICESGYQEVVDARNANEQLNAIAQVHQQAYISEQQAWYEKIGAWFMEVVRDIASFYERLLPQYMERRQPQLDARKLRNKPFKTHKMKRAKPGKDYFMQIFFVLLIIDFYTLIYWRNLSGEDKQQSFGAATVSLDRFSNIQVISLLCILVLLLVERMLSRARYVDDRDYLERVQGISGENRQRKSPLGIRHALTIKLIIYYGLLVLIHVCLGFLVPLYQLAPMYHNPWLCIYYMLWFFYFYYSALQLKHGFPMAPYKQAFSSRDTSFITQNGWRIYKAIPFIWEMKVIIDWTVTSTCLDLYQWFKLDDAYNTLYQNAIQNEYRKAKPEFRQRALWEKIFLGFCFAILLVFIILAPIFLFSGINPIMVQNPVKSGMLTIDLELIATGNSYRIFETKANHIQALSKIDDDSWRLYFEPQSNQIDYADMQKLQFNTYSQDQWTISPPSLRRFIADFQAVSQAKNHDDEMVNFKAKWTFNREFPLGKEKSEGSRVIALSKRDFLPVIQMIQGDNSLPQLGFGGAPIKMAQLESDDEQFVQIGDDLELAQQSNEADQSDFFDYAPGFYFPGFQQQTVPMFDVSSMMPQADADQQQQQYYTPMYQPQQEEEEQQQQIKKPEKTQTHEVKPQQTQQNIKPTPKLTAKQVLKEPVKQLVKPQPQKKEPIMPLNRTHNTSTQAISGHKNIIKAPIQISNQTIHALNYQKQNSSKQTKAYSVSSPNQSMPARQRPSEIKNVQKKQEMQSSKANITTQNVKPLANQTKMNITSKNTSNIVQPSLKQLNRTTKTNDSSTNTQYTNQNTSEPFETTKETRRTDTSSSSNDITAALKAQENKQKKRLLKKSQALIKVTDAFPKILHLNAKDNAEPLAVQQISNRTTSLYSSIELHLNQQAGSIYYWTFSLGSSATNKNSSYLRDTPGVFNSRNTQEEIESENKAEHLKQSTSKSERRDREKYRQEMQKKRIMKEEQNLVVVLYNDHVIGSFFGNAMQLSVLGLYVTFVIAIGRLIRVLFDRISQRVMYEELPDTSQLFELCEGIFIAQQEGDLVREKQLYDLLILMYRSPEALIKISGTKLEYKEQDKE